MSEIDSSTSPGNVEALLDAIAKGLAYSSRSPVLRNPSDSGLQWEGINFPSSDGTTLEGWLIPCAGSDKIIICSHAFGFSKAGFPSYFEPWKSAWGPGNDYEINFVHDYRILHEAGYNVLAYDFRNHGHSAAANGGLTSNNRFEMRDVVGSLDYVRTHPSLAKMKIGLFARCMGANATFRALATNPDAFVGVSCLVAPLLLSARVALDRMLDGAGLPDHADETDRRQQKLTGVFLSEASPVDWAPSVTLPTLTYGVRDDALTVSSDLEAIFNAIGTDEKSMFWIDNTTSRWDGYMFFQRHPKRVLEWFDKYM